MKERSTESLSHLEEGEEIEKYLDPTLWHWWFFLRGRAFQDVTQQNGSFSKRDRHWEVFKRALEGALSHTGTGKTALKFPITQDPTNRHPYPSLFARVPRDPTQSITMSMHALSLLDSTYIRFAWTQSGRTDSEAFKNLRYKDWQYSESDTVFLGDAICITAEIEKPKDASERFSLAEQMSRQILSDWHGVPVLAENRFEIDLVEVACGFFATAIECDEVVWALLVWNDDDARRQAVRFINKITPPFMLAWLKARYIKREYKDKVAPEAYKAEIALEGE